jgi:hypothetical protein
VTAPNEITRADTLAARELMKGWLTPAFAKAVDAGELDGFALWDRAIAQLIRERGEGVE